MEEHELELQAQAIAEDWGVSTELLRETEWTIDSIDGNDGHTHAYLVRFEEDTDAEILSELGIPDGEFERRVSLNAFDEFEPPEPEEPKDDREEEAAFQANAFQTPNFYNANFANLTFQSRASLDTRREHEAFRAAVFSKIGEIEAVLASYPTNLPPRTHNNPPEAIASDSLTPIQIAQVRAIIEQVRSVADRPVPDAALLSVTAKWVLSKLDRAVNAGIDWAVPASIVAATATAWGPLQGVIRDLATILGEWADFLQSVAS